MDNIWWKFPHYASTVVHLFKDHFVGRPLRYIFSCRMYLLYIETYLYWKTTTEIKKHLCVPIYVMIAAANYTINIMNLVICRCKCCVTFHAASLRMSRNVISLTIDKKELLF